MECGPLNCCVGCGLAAFAPVELTWAEAVASRSRFLTGSRNRVTASLVSSVCVYNQVVELKWLKTRSAISMNTLVKRCQLLCKYSLRLTSVSYRVLEHSVNKQPQLINSTNLSTCIPTTVSHSIKSKFHGSSFLADVTRMSITCYEKIGRV